MNPTHYELISVTWAIIWKNKIFVYHNGFQRIFDQADHKQKELHFETNLLKDFVEELYKIMLIK